LQELLTSGWQNFGYPSPINSFWLEFDLDKTSVEEAPPPMLFSNLARYQLDTEWLIRDLFPALHGSELTSVQQQLVRRACNEAPSGFQLLYAISLKPRLDAIRLDFFCSDFIPMINYIRNVISLEAAERVAALADLIEDIERFHLSFDISDEVGSRIGLECSFRHQPPHGSRWQDLLGRLVQQGFCTTEKRDAVLAWPGYDTRKTAPNAWPNAADVHNGYCVRCLSHLKVVFDYEEIIQWKAYLLFRYLRPEHALTNKQNLSTKILSP
jgi:hypothetical protein